MQEKSPLQWKKILLCGIASPLIGGAISILGATVLNSLYGDYSTGTVAFYMAMYAFVPVTIAVASILPIVFIRERRLIHWLLTVAVAAVLFVLLFLWLYFG